MKCFLLLVLSLLLSNNVFAQNTLIGYIDPRDKKCLEAIEKAKKDFVLREILYDFYGDGYSSPIADYHVSFMPQVLAERGIAYAWAYKTDIEGYQEDSKEGFYLIRPECYGETFNKLLELKYGEGFIKSMVRKADSLYIEENKNYVFKLNWEVDPYCVVYGKLKKFKMLWEQNDELNIDFNRYFKYPKRFRKSGGNNFYIECSIVINQDSSIEIKNVDLSNPGNEKFRKLIIKQVKEFINKANWQPATVKGFKVKSSFDFSLQNFQS